MTKSQTLQDDRIGNGVVHDLPAYSEEGVDLTLIRWMLSLSPAERLQALQQNVQSLLRLRGDQTDTRLFQNIAGPDRTSR